MRALILADAESRGALAGARALDAAGWRVSVATPTPRSLAGSSRRVATSHVVPPPQRAGFADAVARVAADEAVDVVFPAGDDWVLALSAERERIGAVVPYPADDAVRCLLDKHRLAEVAGSVGIAVPATVAATAEALARWEGAAAVKPVVHWSTVAGTRTRLEATFAADARAAAERVAEMEAAGAQAVLQQVVDGALVAVSAVVRPDGSLVAISQQRAEAVWPVPFGVSTRAVTVPVEPSASHRIVDLARAVGWHGLVEAQFLVDAEGQWWLIDVNARLYGSLRLAVAAGANLPDLWGRLALDRLPPAAPPVVARAGVRYCWLEGELRRAHGAGELARAVAGAVVAGGVDGLRDPGPGAWASAALARRAVAKARRKATP